MQTSSEQGSSSPAKSGGGESSASRKEQAAEWYVLVQAGELSIEQERQFEDWMTLEQNAETFRRMEAVWHQFDAVDSGPAKSTVKGLFNERFKSKNTRPAARALGATLLLAIVSVLGWQLSFDRSFTVDSLLADYRTGVGEQQRVVLSDQTQLYLNTATAVDIEYSDSQRTIRLLQGEIKLDVAKDVSRPLVVISEHGSVRALGTVFIVRDHGGSTEVTVTESQVEACLTEGTSQLSTDGTSCRTLSSGEHTFIHDQIERPQVLNTAFSSEWNRQKLMVDNQPLLHVLDELARYRKGYMHIDREALQGLQISGVFPLDDTDTSLRLIARSLPIKIRSFSPWLTLVEAD